MKTNKVSSHVKQEQEKWPYNLTGKYAVNNIDGVETFLKYKKEDLEMEKRGNL